MSLKLGHARESSNNCTGQRVALVYSSKSNRKSIMNKPSVNACLKYVAHDFSASSSLAAASAMDMVVGTSLSSRWWSARSLIDREAMDFASSNLGLVGRGASWLNCIKSFLWQTAVAESTDYDFTCAVVDSEGEFIGDVDADLFEAV